MLRFFYDTRYKYTNRTLIDVSNDTSYRDIDYLNIDTPDTINGHIIYRLEAGERVPTYVMDLSRGTRYFVSGITPLSANRKYQISLLRDIMSESKNWATEDAYIEAGVATDFNKYKRWNLPFTNTKINEERFNFGGKSSFFVFYTNEQQINAGTGEITENTDIHVKMTDLISSNIQVTKASLSSINGYEYLDGRDYDEFLSKSMVLSFGLNDNKIYRYTFRNGSLVSTLDDNVYLYGPPWGPGGQQCMRLYVYPSDIANNVNNCKTQLETAVTNFLNNYIPSNYDTISSSIVNDLNSNYVGKVLYLADQPTKLFKIRRDKSENHSERKTLANTTVSTLVSAIRNISFPFSATNTNDENYDILGTFATFLRDSTTYAYSIGEISSITSFDMTFNATYTDENNVVKTVPKLPKSAVRCINIVEGSGDVTNETIAQSLMLAQAVGGSLDENAGQIVDIQFLPFSVATTSDVNQNIKINNIAQYAKILETDDFEYFTNLTDLTNINKETDSINIVSPSRQSQFMFRPYDNDGNMEFTTSVTIKPFASTIYVRPSTKGLLQYDWQDKDCLVISEDFSLTKVSSAWADYVRSNKNYQRVFDRGLQSKAYERDWERRVEKEQARSDQYNATVLANQQGRNMTGNIPIISTIAGLFSQGFGQISGTDSAYNRYMSAAQLDRQYNQAMYEESVRLAQDQFNLQLENIKAQPLIPTNITTIDCKLLDGVYLEFYSTNPTEKKAISDFYKFNGNRIETFGRFQDYYGWYVKGKIIKSVNYTQPEIDEVNRRLSTGIFTEVSYD